MDAKGVPFTRIVVIDADLAMDEFAELVTEEGDIEIKHGGPFLPNIIMRAFQTFRLRPFKDHIDYLKKWCWLPAKVLGFSPDFSMYETMKAACELIDEEEAKAENAAASRNANTGTSATTPANPLAVIPHGTNESGPSNHQSWQQ